MKKKTKGFTLIELLITLVIVSIITWIIAEIIKVPLMTWRFNKRNAETIYVAGLSMQRIEVVLKTANLNTIKALNSSSLNFETKLGDKINYFCENNNLLEVKNNISALLSKYNNCDFEVKSYLGCAQVNIKLIFSIEKNMPIPFYREIYVCDAKT